MMRRLALVTLLALWPALAAAQFATIGPTPSTADNGDRLATTAWFNNLLGVGFTIGGNLVVSGNLTVGGSIIDGNGILFTNIVAPATPSAGTTRGYVDSTNKVFSAKNDAGTVSNTVVPSVAVANQFMTGISAAGVITRAQPAVTDISGLGTGVATWLATPSSANLRGALTDETGTGLAYFQGGDIGTPSAGVATNITALNATQLTTGAVPAARMPAFTGDCTTSAGAIAVTCTQSAADFKVTGLLQTGGDARTTAQFDVTSSVALANVPGLSVTVGAGLTYGFDAKLYTVSNGASGVKAAIAGTATATAITFTEICTEAVGIVCYGRSAALGSSPAGSTTATLSRIDMTGTITVNAGGTLTAQFAQNVSGGVASSVLIGSTMKVWKIQ